MSDDPREILKAAGVECVEMESSALAPHRRLRLPLLQGDVMDKKTRKSLADAMRHILDTIEDPKVEIRDARIESTNGFVQGCAPGSGFTEHRSNGVRTYAITMEFYTPGLDRAQEDGSWWKLDPSIGEVMGRVPWTD